MEPAVNHGAYEIEKISKHEKPSRTKISLLKMGAVYFGIELLFSLEIALTVPILLESNVSSNIYSYVYFLSPIFGFIFQPILGAWSDRCQSKYGRRRPFIFALGVASYIGISLILKGRSLGEWFGDGNSQIPMFGIALTGIGVTILDFSADTCDSPLRAYLLDSCNSRDQHMALNLHAFLGGVGGALGYILSAVNWKNSFLSFLGDEGQILFILMSVLFLNCLYMTLNAAQEERYSLENSYESPESDHFGLIESRKEEAFLKNLFKSFQSMPKELSRLFVCQTIGWLAFYSTTLFFTDYIAQNIYHGNPSAERNSPEYLLYEHGIKMGSWCLLTYSVSSAVSAIVVENFLLEKYTPKTLFLFTFLFYVLSCVTMLNLTNIFTILPFCSCFGIMLTTLTTIPYQLLYEFHNDKAFVYSNKLGTKRGFGIDCSILGSCHFLSQIIISSFMSFLTSAYGNEVILICGALFSSIGFFYVLVFVIFPKKYLN